MVRKLVDCAASVAGPVVQAGAYVFGSLRSMLTSDKTSLTNAGKLEFKRLLASLPGPMRVVNWGGLTEASRTAIKQWAEKAGNAKIPPGTFSLAFVWGEGQKPLTVRGCNWSVFKDCVYGGVHGQKPTDGQRTWSNVRDTRFLLIEDPTHTIPGPHAEGITVLAIAKTWFDRAFINTRTVYAEIAKSKGGDK